MAQVDLRPLLTPPAKVTPPPDSLEPASHPAPEPPVPNEAPMRLSGAQWTNLAFVVCACLGALFSAAFLFRGGELLQEVAAWPRELFHGRPATVAAATTSPNEMSRLTTLAGDAEVQPVPANDSGDPFSSASKLLNPHPPATASHSPNEISQSTPFSSPSSVLRQLNTADPGGDSLSRALTQAPSNLPQAQSITSEANTAPSIAQNAVTNNPQRANEQVSSANERVKQSSDRVANTVKRTSLRNAHRVSRVSVARQSFRTAKPSIFKFLFGSRRKGRVAINKKTSTTYRKSSVVHAGKRANNAIHRNVATARNAADRRTLKTVRSSTGRSGGTAMSSSTKTMPQSRSRSQPMMSGATTWSLRSTAPTHIAPAAAALRSVAPMAHSFGGIGGIGGIGGAGGMRMSGARGFGRAGGR